MQVHTKEFDAIINAMSLFIFHPEIRSLLDAEENKSVVDGITAMNIVHLRHAESKRKTAEYVAAKREENKNFARSKKEIEKANAARAKREAKNTQD